MDKTQVLIPQDLTELAKALGQATPRSRILAGGTDLIISLHSGKQPPDMLIDLSGVPELVYIAETPADIRIGAMATFNMIKEHPAIRKNFPALADAAGHVGSNQIRNRATLGGNLANASPAGDAIPVLAMLQAKISAISSAGLLKEYGVAEVVTGAGKTCLAADEVIVSIAIPRPAASGRNAFIKLGSRSAVTIAMINLAMGIDLADDGRTIRSARLVIGAIAPTALRLPEIEGKLAGRLLDDSLAQELTDRLSRLVEKTAPLEFEGAYKKEAVRGPVMDLLQKLAPEVYGPYCPL